MSGSRGRRAVGTAFLRILQAPPGFEPEMEALQTEPRASILLIRPAFWSALLAVFSRVWE